MSSQLMQGKRGLIMGLANDKSIAWGIAKALADAGAELAFSYQGEALLKRVGPLAEQLGSDTVLPCDVSDMDSVDALFAELEKKWGKMDFIVHAIGDLSTGVTGETHHVDAGYHVVGMKAVDAPDMNKE
ncbi:MAG: SDR family oxidoreductase [Marivivens sp.]|nr:SDR family oxidoreductase [Marivivens sp.]